MLYVSVAIIMSHSLNTLTRQLLSNNFVDKTENLTIIRLASYEYLIRERGVVPERLVIFGRSLGAAVAGEVATQRAAAGLILESAFPSMQSMADEHYLGLPANWFVDAEYNLSQKLSNIAVPTCIIHGEYDRIVPITLGRQVYESARHPKTWYMVPRAGHNDVP